MKYYFDNGDEREMDWNEAKSIHDQYRIYCICDWLEGGGNLNLKPEQYMEVAKRVYAIVDDDDWLSEQIGEAENDAVEKVLKEMGIKEK